MDKKALLISISLGLFIFLAMGLCCIVFTTALLSYLYGTDSYGLSRAFEETMFLIKNSNMIFPGFAWGLICTAIVYLLDDLIAIKQLKYIRSTREDSIVLSGISWILCSIVGWFTPHILYTIQILVYSL